MTRDTRREREVAYIAKTQEQLIALSWDDRKLRALLVKVGIVAA